ncbi:fasting-inducible integral membrane protein tm6p1-related [Anaeramoeba flamelloides]|uniref:Fasting-inducible integral membrane protein tm6p1-related n=1 Tax=Anaeramoeba flamelloides TaxID=1746091 RepID=A0AAV7ZPY5_9EUKA|nr:fasting-inducible integral membrane protein tm6p1-related [Anaeramoeba flamelloides]KAJ6238981.1 fasting-inducible integral membrane protein tm6p1-related [Anaeramoeba flamelloides]
MKKNKQGQLTNIKGNHLFNLAIVIAVFALVICQIFARSLGHVEVPIPFHSACERVYPEYFIASSFLTVSAILVLLSQHFYYKRQMYLYPKDKKIHRFMYAAMAIAALGLSCQAIFPIQQDWPKNRATHPEFPIKIVWYTYLHFLFAGLFFCFSSTHYILYIIFMIRNGFHKNPNNTNEDYSDHGNGNNNCKKPINQKKIFWMKIVHFIFLFVSALLSTTLQYFKASTTKSRMILISCAAFCQYTAIILILLYLLIFFRDLKNISLLVILHKNNNQNDLELIENAYPIDND